MGTTKVPLNICQTLINTNDQYKGMTPKEVQTLLIEQTPEGSGQGGSRNHAMIAVESDFIPNNARDGRYTLAGDKFTFTPTTQVRQEGEDLVYRRNVQTGILQKEVPKHSETFMRLDSESQDNDKNNNVNKKLNKACLDFIEAMNEGEPEEGDKDEKEQATG